MSEDSRDRILDAFLEEMLRGRTPPDLAPQILRAWALRAQAAGSGAVDDHDSIAACQSVPPLAPGTQVPAVLPQVMSDRGVPAVVADTALPPRVATDRRSPTQVGARYGGSSRSRSRQLLAVASSLLLLAASLTLLLWWEHEPQSEVVQRPEARTLADNAPTGSRPEATSSPRPTVAPAEASGGPHNSATDSPSRMAAAEPQSLAGIEPPAARDTGDAGPVWQADEGLVERTSHPVGSPRSDAQILALIDSLLADRWHSAGVIPAPAASGSQWCERVFADLLGRAPTDAELAAFAAGDPKVMRVRVVDTLLQSEPFSQHWARVWSQMLIETDLATNNPPISWQSTLAAFLQSQFVDDVPFNRTVMRLVSAEGSPDSSADDYDPAVSFLLSAVGNQAIPATTRIARVLLGQQADCARCHDHPISGWSQERFWQLNSFLRQMAPVKHADTGQLVLGDKDFRERSGDGQDAPVYYVQPDQTLQAAYPVFLDGTALPTDGRVAQVDRRRELARLISGSQEMCLATANRVWQYFFGYGFVNPVDDMGPHNRPSHPELLQTLAEQFQAHQFDMKRLIRWIVLSDAYARSDAFTTENQADDPSAGAAPLFTRRYRRPALPADVVAAVTLLVEAHAAEVKPAAAMTEPLLARPETQLFSPRPAQIIAPPKSHPSAAGASTAILSQVTPTAPDSPAGRIIGSSMTSLQKVEHLFRLALGRGPTKNELTAALQLVDGAPEDSQTRLADLWWALANRSPSFRK